MIYQHGFRQWLSADRQQAIAWANIDNDVLGHIATQGHNELIWHHGSEQNICEIEQHIINI